MSKPEIICINKSKIAQVEYKAKACFLALLRRRRLWSVAQRSRFFVFRQCKGRNMFSADYYEFSHVPFIVQPLAVIVQLSVQVL